MAKITYSKLLGPYGEIEDFYDGGLNLQGEKSSDTKVIYKSTGEDQNKFTITGSGFVWDGDVLTAGNITSITFTTKEGDPYLTIKGGQYTVEEFNNTYVNGGLEGVEALLVRAKDIVTGSKISDKIESGDGADLVRAGAGGDSLNGGTGKDRLFGDAGNDYIFGGADNDRMTGGGGSDSFHFSSGNGNDVIADFDAKGGGNRQDHISLYQGETFTVLRAGNDTILDFGDGETLRLLDVKRADFSVEADVHWVLP